MHACIHTYLYTYIYIYIYIHIYIYTFVAIPELGPKTIIRMWFRNKIPRYVYIYIHIYPSGYVFSGVRQQERTGQFVLSLYETVVLW